MRGYSVFKLSLCCVLVLWASAANAQAQEPVTDPTKPLGISGSSGVSAVNAENPIRLTSVLIARDRKVAIINGQPLQENQTLKGVGALIKRIDANAVTLQQNGKTWRVALDNTAVRK